MKAHLELRRFQRARPAKTRILAHRAPFAAPLVQCAVHGLVAHARRVRDVLDLQARVEREPRDVLLRLARNVPAVALLLQAVACACAHRVILVAVVRLLWSSLSL